MIYFIQSGSAIKAGYSKNVDKRMRAYRTHNPDVVLLHVIEGDKKLERFIHKQLAPWRVRHEWFDYTFEAKEIIEHIIQTKQA